MNKIYNRIGLRYGRLTVLEKAGSLGTSGRWLCLCDCGEQTVVESGNLQKGNTRSCGCLRREVCEQRGRDA